VEFIKEIMYRLGVSNNILTDNETRASKSTMPQCHTHRVMVKWSTQMA
jgi:hypothetical protein